MFTPKINTFPMGLQSVEPQQPPPPPPEDRPEDLTRIAHYNADHSGCGLWRMSWPAHLINFHNKAMITESTVMITEPRWYQNVKVIRIQRQATPHQLKFVQFLKNLQKEIGFRIQALNCRKR